MAFLFSGTLFGQQEYPLYPEGIPNSKVGKNAEHSEDRGEAGRAVYKVSVPTLTAFIPETPSGTAVVVCPGGGYQKLAIDKEGFWVAEKLKEKGIAAFVLKYRMPDESTCIDKTLAPLQDAQQALRFVRENAERFNLNENNIGILGFSAGGHLAGSAAVHFLEKADPGHAGKTSLRPDFAGLIYPVISMKADLTHSGSRANLLGRNPSPIMVEKWSLEEQVGPNTPPVFFNACW